MDRRDVIAAFAAVRGDAIVITGPGVSSGMLWEAHPHPATIYNMDLAYAGPMAMGIALGAPEHQVVSLEGDGSRYAAAAGLGTYARYPLPNLTLLTLANGIWGTGDGSVETTIGAHQWNALAIASGWNPAQVVTASELGTLADALRTALAEPGPWFICAVVARSSEDASLAADGTRRPRARATVDIVQSADATRAFLAGRRR